MGRNSFVIYDDWKVFFDSVSDADAGKLIKALYAYRENGSIENITQSSIYASYNFMISTIARDEEKYRKKCEANAENIRKRYER